MISNSSRSYRRRIAGSVRKRTRDHNRQRDACQQPLTFPETNAAYSLNDVVLYETDDAIEFEPRISYDVPRTIALKARRLQIDDRVSQVRRWKWVPHRSLNDDSRRSSIALRLEPQWMCDGDAPRPSRKVLAT